MGAATNLSVGAETAPSLRSRGPCARVHLGNRQPRSRTQMAKLSFVAFILAAATIFLSVVKYC